jgi:uncharacterized protein involved in outer membrane biogenesis
MNTETPLPATPTKRSAIKTILTGLLIVLVLLVVAAALWVHFFLDGAVKRGVEKMGPKMTQTDVRLGSVHIGLFSGNGALKNLVVGNPLGFKSSNAITLGKASVRVKPGTVFGSKVIIPTIEAEAPEVFCEQNANGNNLNIIRANLKKASADGQSGKPSPQSEPESSSKHRLEVDNFLITGGKVHIDIDALGVKRSGTLALSEIHLQNLGTGPEGITPAELSEKVLSAVLDEALKQSAALLTGLGKNIQLPDSVGGSNTVDTVTKGIGDLLKSKKK